ncbi:MAG: hypothetical protein LJE83_05140 [Gammaproteobacteria bacterium]|nr:hypothetical protein [Gammaproteobacteria bacterium]
MTLFWLLKPGNTPVFIILLMTLQTSVCSTEEFVEAANGSEYLANNSFYGTASYGLNATINLLGGAK